MRSWTWATLTVLGLTMMMVSYDRWMRLDLQAPWAFGVLAVGHEEPVKAFDVGATFQTRLRYLPASQATDAMIRALGAGGPTKVRNLEARLRPKLIEMPGDQMVLLSGWLREGRMPDPGRDEVLAGNQARLEEPLVMAGRPATVVGVLQPSVALFSDCFLVPAHPSVEAVFLKGDPSVASVNIARVSDHEFHDQRTQANWAQSFPGKSFSVLLPEARPGLAAYFAYVAGQALFLLGGSGLLIELYRRMAGKVAWPWLASPLRELARRPRLLWSIHLAYFGLYVIGASLIAVYPLMHTGLMVAIQGELGSEGKGVLAVAGKAYGTGNILWAALVTFAINFFIGSFAQISVPSMIIPGCGALLSGFRAILWGIMLGPVERSLAMAMIPHTGTLLLEGEGYILATFFAILIPVALLGHRSAEQKPPRFDEMELVSADFKAQGDTARHRFRAANAMNLKGNLWVAIVLAVAACYEATEVILMMGR